MSVMAIVVAAVAAVTVTAAAVAAIAVAASEFFLLMSRGEILKSLKKNSNKQSVCANVFFKTFYLVTYFCAGKSHIGN